MNQYRVLILAVLLALIGFGCASFPQPYEVRVPQPRYDNQGKFLSPVTQDGVMAEWCDMAIKARAGSSIGKGIGQYAGTKAVEKVPLVGGLIGGIFGKAVGRKVAIKAAGGKKHIRETSDLSFDKVDDLAVYLYATYSSSEHYRDALKATIEIYPKLKKRYEKAIMKARAKRQS
jgi:hypothetical protein